MCGKLENQNIHKLVHFTRKICTYLFFSFILYSDPLLTNDTTKLGLSCISLYGEPVKPADVLGGYENEKITDASLLFVTFAIKKHLSNAEIEKARAWFEKFVEYVKNFDDKDLQLAYTPIDLLESDMKL